METPNAVRPASLALAESQNIQQNDQVSPFYAGPSWYFEIVVVCGDVKRVQHLPRLISRMHVLAVRLTRRESPGHTYHCTARSAEARQAAKITNQVGIERRPYLFSLLRKVEYRSVGNGTQDKIARKVMPLAAVPPPRPLY